MNYFIYIDCAVFFIMIAIDRAAQLTRGRLLPNKVIHCIANQARTNFILNLFHYLIFYFRTHKLQFIIQEN